ncbi:coiled-coil domain-containing protein [Alkalimarinus alittae]|uniref:Uncharacterized protein n=1 Tax=Alkalimarinus alittae TaxID=2961619 RepID=A0ABY6N222_9ALTE|nr:hypothetical protein [Alkalimarinus alittae]UZE96085.1 hypothetical protein NKI27_18880 [Alkalimarinus alittae]
MAVSPEQREIERKARELKVQEDRLTRRLEQQQRQEDKLAQKQQTLIEREASVAAQDQDIRRREQQLEQQLKQFHSDQSKRADELQGYQRASKRRLSFMLPILLMAGAASGYLTYDYYAKNNVFSQRLTQANQNVNKLSSVLTKAEDQKAEVLQKLVLKEDELNGKQRELDTRLKALEASIASLTSEKEALLQASKKLESTLAESAHKLNDSSDLIARLSEENEQIKAAMVEHEALLAEMDVREQALTAAFEEKKAELIDSALVMGEQEEAIAEQAQRQLAIELKLATLQEKHDVLNVNRDELAETLDELTQSYKAIKSELASLKAEKEKQVILEP